METLTIEQKFGRRIKELRLKQNISQEELAELLDVNLYSPKNKEDFKKLIQGLLNKDFDFCVVRLGKDDL